MPVYTATRQLRSRTAVGLPRASLTVPPPAQVEVKAEAKSETQTQTQTAVKIEQNQVTIKNEEALTSVKLEDANSSAQIKAEDTQQSASQPVARVKKRSRSTSAEDTESPASSKQQRTDGRKEATTEGVQDRRAPSSKKKVGGKKKKEKKKKKTSGRPSKPPATDPSNWRQSRVPFFDTICATAAMKEYRLSQLDLLDLTYDEERSKNGPTYWNLMKLYKTRDVEHRAWRKHGGPEGWEWK